MSGNSQALASHRAPLFYDSNDTTYYLDPNSTGVSLRIAGAIQSNHVAWTGEMNKIQWHSGNLYFQNMSDTWFLFRNSNGAEPFSLHATGYGVATGSWRAPIFYDSNNTAYYANLDGTTYCYYLQSATTIQADSDRRIKDNIETIPNALDKVLRLRGTTFTRTDLPDKSKKYMGLIAQEVLAVIPEVVGGSEETRYSVSYGEIVAVLIESIKELNAKVDTLQKTIQTYETGDK